MDGVLLLSLRGFVNRVRKDGSIRVIVLESADPEFFSAHGDMGYLTEPDALSTATRAAIAAAEDTRVPDGMNILQALSEEVHQLPQVTIGKLSGFARGAGNEFLMYLDMRFAAIGRSGQSQTEALIGIFPGGGGTVHMTRLAGRARALELILGGELVNAELDGFVSELAGRIARLRPEVVSAIKAAVNAMAPAVKRAAYTVENDGLMTTMGPDVTRRAHEPLAAGIQTREGELEHERIVDSI